MATRWASGIDGERWTPRREVRRGPSARPEPEVPARAGRRLLIIALLVMSAAVAWALWRHRLWLLEVYPRWRSVQEGLAAEEVAEEGAREGPVWRFPGAAEPMLQEILKLQNPEWRRRLVGGAERCESAVCRLEDRRLGDRYLVWTAVWSESGDEFDPLESGESYLVMLDSWGRLAPGEFRVREHEHAPGLLWSRRAGSDEPGPGLLLQLNEMHPVWAGWDCDAARSVRMFFMLLLDGRGVVPYGLVTCSVDREDAPTGVPVPISAGSSVVVAAWYRRYQGGSVATGRARSLATSRWTGDRLRALGLAETDRTGPLLAVGLLEDPAPEVRARAAVVAGLDADLEPHIEKLLHDEVPFVRCAAARVLLRARDASLARDALVTLLRAGEPGLSSLQSAEYDLGRLRCPEVGRAIVERLEEGPVGVLGCLGRRRWWRWADDSDYLEDAWWCSLAGCLRTEDLRGLGERVVRLCELASEEECATYWTETVLLRWAVRCGDPVSEAHVSSMLREGLAKLQDDGWLVAAILLELCCRDAPLADPRARSALREFATPRPGSRGPEGEEGLRLLAQMLRVRWGAPGAWDQFGRRSDRELVLAIAELDDWVDEQFRFGSLANAPEPGFLLGSHWLPVVRRLLVATSEVPEPLLRAYWRGVSCGYRGFATCLPAEVARALTPELGRLWSRLLAEGLPGGGLVRLFARAAHEPLDALVLSALDDPETDERVRDDILIALLAYREEPPSDPRWLECLWRCARREGAWPTAASPGHGDDWDDPERIGWTVGVPYHPAVVHEPVAATFLLVRWEAPGALEFAVSRLRVMGEEWLEDALFAFYVPPALVVELYGDDPELPWRVQERVWRAEPGAQPVFESHPAW